ncbi:diacylglycerol/lipid kinase family protein [Pleomorphovibrio marinus]|uniref:diacylglycerol/lipid kinase family protein n=1 Tax=Pleomorphovibrio marinus TaxID=2164132 RepID=UPI000E0A80CE|nr:diacylglycerol kinase family protein [Pleomorphovibrio marinus]
MKVLFVVNPISGGVDKAPFLKEAIAFCDHFGITQKIFETSGKNDKKRLQKKIKGFMPDRVASVGGDGTTLFTAGALLDLGIPMGIIPLGSANGMARELYIAEDPMEAFQDFISSHLVAGLDMLCINGKHYTLHLGDVGINANLVKSYEEDSNRGMLTYAKYFFEGIKNSSSFQLHLIIDDKEYEENCYMAAICNSQRYGTGVVINRKGNPMDGKFEIVCVNEVNASALLNAGLNSFRETFNQQKYSSIYQGEHAKLIFDRPRLLQLDGEVVDEFKEIEVTILPGKIPLLTHRGNIYLNQ